MDLQPVGWAPPKDLGLVGLFARNDRLGAVRRVPVPGEGPEDVLGLDDGRVAYGLSDGRVMTSASDGSRHELLADTGGRPLGMELHPDGSIVVCDAQRGLLRIEGDRVDVLVDRHEGEPLLFTNNAAVASDGTIYFSVTSRRFGIEAYRSDIIEHSNTGRLFRRTPAGEVELMLDGLSFANGVALSEDEASVFVAETGEYRIRRVRVEHPGVSEVFVENLPGIPDNLTASAGIVWAALFSPRNRPLDLLLPRPRLRALVARLPDKLQPQPVRHGFVVGFGEATGAVVHNLQDPAGGFAPVTSARMHEGRLWLGSLSEPAIAVLDLT
jgi:sugar lactone lactonase YvrE